MADVGQRQRNAERWYARQLLDALGLQPTRLVVGDKPDCRVYLPDGNRLAIELAEYHCRPKGRKFEAAWDKFDGFVTDKIKEHPCCDALLHTNRYVALKECKLPGHSELPALASQLVETIAHRLRTLKSRRRVTINDLSRYPLLACYCDRVLMNRSLAVHSHSYCPEVSCAWHALECEELTRIVSEKSAKSAAYRVSAKGAPLWLLIHCADYTASTFAPRPEELAAYCRENEPLLKDTGFDRIYFQPVRLSEMSPFVLFTNE